MWQNGDGTEYYPSSEKQLDTFFNFDIRDGIEETGYTSDSERQSRKLTLGKIDAYVSRFGEDGVDTKNGSLLADETYALELDRAKRMMADIGKDAYASFVPYNTDKKSSIGFEICVDNCRFSIPRDYYLIGFDKFLWLDINTSVVSVLQQESWPNWLNAKIDDEAILDETATNDVYDLNPETIAMLKKLSNGALIDEFRDLAIYLGLGDKVKVNRKKIGMIDSIAGALKNFNVDGEDDLIKILNLVGLKIINTSDRLKPLLDDGQLRLNDKTEIDSLMEAIKRTGLL